MYQYWLGVGLYMRKDWFVLFLFSVLVLGSLSLCLQCITLGRMHGVFFLFPCLYKPKRALQRGKRIEMRDMDGISMIWDVRVRIKGLGQ